VAAPRALRALALALPFAAAACGDSSSTGPAGRDLDATSLSTASNTVDAVLDEPVLQFLAQDLGGSISFDRAASRLRTGAASPLFRARVGAPVLTREARVASGVRLQIARAAAASSAPLFDASMHGQTYVATPDSLYHDESRTGAPANGFAIVLTNEAESTVGTIEVRDSSTTSTARQAITILTSAGTKVAHYTESLSGSLSETGPSSLRAEAQGTIGNESKVSFERSASIDLDAEGLGTIAYASEYTLPGGARTGVELRLVEPAAGAASSLTLTYGRSTFRVEIPSVLDEVTDEWAASDTARILVDGRLAAYLVPGDADDEARVVAPDGDELPAQDLLVFSRAEELAAKLMQVDTVVGVVQEFVGRVISHAQMIP
jgi:hypothetical protein